MTIGNRVRSQQQLGAHTLLFTSSTQGLRAVHTTSVWYPCLRVVQKMSAQFDGAVCDTVQATYLAFSDAEETLILRSTKDGKDGMEKMLSSPEVQWRQ